MAIQSVKIPIDLELRNMQSAINTLKSALSNVSKNSGISVEINKDLDRVEKKFVELQAIASRPFSKTSELSSFQNQLLKLGDSVNIISNKFKGIQFKDIDLSKIQGAETTFNNLQKTLTDAQAKVNNFMNEAFSAKMKDSGFENIVNTFNNILPKGITLDTSSYEKACDTIKNKLAELIKEKRNVDNELSDLTLKQGQAAGKQQILSKAEQEFRRIQSLSSGQEQQKALEAFKNSQIENAKKAGFGDDVESYLKAYFGIDYKVFQQAKAEKEKIDAEIKKSLNFSKKGTLGAKSLQASTDLTKINDQIQLKEAQQRRAAQNLQIAQTADSAIGGMVDDPKIREGYLKAGEAAQVAAQQVEQFKAQILQTVNVANKAGGAAHIFGNALESTKGQIAQAESKLKMLNEQARKMDLFKSRIAMWFGFTRIINTVRRTITNAVNEIRELDKVMTEISVVTKMSQEDLWGQIKAYSEIANQYGVSTRGVYQVSQLYYQQGLQTAEVMQLTTETLKMAKIASLDYTLATDYMTVAIRGFKMEMSDAQTVTDVYSALAAGTASNTKELAVAMSKTASSAEAVGSSFESTSAMIATMIATTREAPENIGSAMKSIISRYGEMTSDPTKLVDSEGEEMSLNRVDKALRSVGITLQDVNGEFRDFDDVILELAKSWDTIDTNTQRYIATIMAGNRQQSRFLALVGNYEEYARALDIAENSEDTGTLQALKTMDSLETKIQGVKTAWEQFYNSMGIEKMFKGVLGTVTKIINNLSKMSKPAAFGTIINLFKGIKVLITGISNGISGTFQKFQASAQSSIDHIKNRMLALEEIKNLNLATEDASAKLEEILRKYNLLNDTVFLNLIVKEGVGKNNTGNTTTTTTTSNSTSPPKVESTNQGTLLPNGTQPKKGSHRRHKQVNEANRNAKQENKGRPAQGAGNATIPKAEKDIKNLGDASSTSAGQVEEQGKSASGFSALIAKIKENSSYVNISLRVAGSALQTFGAMLTAWALTLEDKSTDKYEKSKTAAGYGSLMSTAGSALTAGASTAMMGAPIWLSIIAAVVAALPGLVSGISQLVDGYNYETDERLAAAKQEAEASKNDSIKAKGEANNLQKSITNLKDLEKTQYDSAEAAQAYKDAMNAMADEYPNLISHYDSAGNAIIDVAAAEEALTQARYDAAVAARQAQKDEVEKNRDSIDNLNFVKSELTGEFRTPKPIKSGDEGRGFITFGKTAPEEIMMYSDGNAKSSSTFLSIEQLANMREEDVAKNWGDKRGSDFKKLVTTIADKTELSLFELTGMDEIDWDILTNSEIVRISQKIVSALDGAIKKEEGVLTSSLESLASIDIQASARNLAITENIDPDRIEENIGWITTIGGRMLNNWAETSGEGKSLDILMVENVEEYNAEKDAILKSIFENENLDFEEISKIYDNVEQYSTLENYKEALIDSGVELESDLGKALVEHFTDTVGKDKQRIRQGIWKSSMDNTTRSNMAALFGETNWGGELLVDYGDSVMEAVNLIDDYTEKGLQAKASVLIGAVEGLYTSIGQQDDSVQADLLSIVEDIDWTSASSIESAIDAMEAYDEQNTEVDLSSEISALQDARDNLSFNLATEVQLMTKAIMEGVEGIEKTISSQNKGMGLDDALEAFKTITAQDGFKDMSFDELFTYDATLKQWVYTQEGFGATIKNQTREIENSRDSAEKAYEEIIDFSNPFVEYDEKEKEYIARKSEDLNKLNTEIEGIDKIDQDFDWSGIFGGQFKDNAFAQQQIIDYKKSGSELTFTEWLAEQVNLGQLEKEQMDAIYTAWGDNIINLLSSGLDIEAIMSGTDAGNQKSLLQEIIAKSLQEKYPEMSENSAKVLSEALIDPVYEAIQRGDIFSLETLIGAENITHEMRAATVTTPAENVRNAISELLSSNGTVLSETSQKLLEQKGLTDGLVSKNGVYLVGEVNEMQIIIDDLLSEVGGSLEEINSTLAEVFKSVMEVDISSASEAIVSDMTDISIDELEAWFTATGQELPRTIEGMENFFSDILEWDVNTQSFKVIEGVSFEEFFARFGQNLSQATDEYLDWYSSNVEKILDNEANRGEKAIDELESLSELTSGEKTGVVYLQNVLSKVLGSDGAVASLFAQYGVNIENGIATIGENADIYHLINTITQLDGIGDSEISNSIIELKDSIIELFDSWVEALSSGLSGELSNADAEALKQQFSFLSDMDFTKTKNGLKLSRDAAFQLYTELKKIDGIRAGLAFDALAESLAEAGSGYEDVASTMATIAKLNKELANVPVSSERRAELERELAVAEEILRVRSQDPDSFNFMDKELPAGMQGPENYWNSVGQAYKVMNESASSGYMEIQDYVNLITHMSQMVEAAGGEFSIKGYNAAQLIEMGMSALSNVDGEGVKVNLENLGIDILGGTEGMTEGFADAIKEMAHGQIEMLDAAIQMLETIVAMEEIGNIDTEGNGIDLDDILDFSVEGEVNYQEEYNTIRESLLKNEELKETLDSFFIDGKSLTEWLSLSAEEFNALSDEAKQSFIKALEAFSNLSEGDYDINDVMGSLQDMINQFGLEGTIILPIDKNGIQVIAEAGSPEVIKIEWNSEEVKNIIEKNNQYSLETIQEMVKKWALGDTKGFTSLDYTMIYQIIGKVTVDKDGNYTFMGQKFGPGEEEKLGQAIIESEKIKSELPEGQDFKLERDNKGNITYTTTYGVNNKVELTVDENGDVTYTFGEYSGKSIEEVIDKYWADNEQKLLSYGVTKEQFVATFKGTVGIEAQPKLLTPETLKGSDGITQEIIDEYGIDTSQVNTIAAAFATVDWSPIGEKIAEGISKALTTVGEGTDTEAGIPIDELTLKPTGLKVDATGIEPTLSSGEEALSNIPIASLTLTPETLYIDIANKTPQLKEGQTVTIENIPNATGTVTGSITITNNGTWSAAEGQTSPEVTGYTSANGTVETVTINGSSFKVTPIAGAPTNLDGELDPIKSGFVKVEGNYYSVDLSSGTQLNPGMDLSGITAGSAQVNATSYTVTFTNANGTTSQSVIVKGEAQLNAVLQNATLGNNGGWILSGISAEADVSISAKSENALVNFFDTLVNKLKNIEVTYQEPTPVGPGPDTSTPGYYVSGLNNNSGYISPIGHYSELDASAVEDITAQVDNGTFQNGTFTITEVRADGTQFTTTATLAQIQAGEISFGEGGPTTGSKGESNGGQGTGNDGGAIALPPVDTSEAENSVQTAASTMSSDIADAGSSGAASAASAIQKTLDGIKSKTVTINVNYPPTITIGVDYSISVTTTSSGPGTVKGRISSVSAPGLNSYGMNSASGSLAKGNVNGKALVSGTHKTLMGELGPELVVSNGRYFVVGQSGAEFVDLADDAIVFNHLQTKKLLGSGSAGHGRPITNERNATSLATGNAGPAMASASAALAQLRQIRAMWQSMLDASAKDLGSMGGSGGGGGGGGGGGEETAAVLADVEKWYNWLRQIENIEKHISIEQAKRANMRNGRDYFKSLERELDMLKEQQAIQEDLIRAQKEYYDVRRKALANSSYGQIFTYTEHGLMQYVEEEGKGLDILEKLNERNEKGVAVMDAKKQLSYLKSLGFDVNALKTNDDGTKAEKAEDQMQNFWDEVDAWKEELDSLYDSYHDLVVDAEENTEKMNEILQEYIDNQLSVEEKLRQAIEDREQAEIDKLEKEKEVFEEASQAYIDGLSEALSKEQDMYNKNETDEETSRLQRQLAILQRSGGSASEIKSLQDQIDSRLKDAYFQEQQDQIDAIQEASDNQIEKLQTQIDLMTETLEYQKEHGLLWYEVYEMMSQWTPEQMLQFIEQYTKSYQENSALQNEEDSKETLKELEIYTAKREQDALDAAENERNAAWSDYYNNLDLYSDDLKEKYKDFAQEKFNEAYGTGNLAAGKAAADKVFADAKQAEDEAALAPVEPEKPVLVSQEGQLSGGQMNVRSEPSRSSSSKGRLQSGGTFTATGYANGWLRVEDAIINGKKVNGYMKYDNYEGYYKGINVKELPSYSSGGDIDFTGLAMVHGTKNNPENILSAEHTKLLRQGIFSNSNHSLAATVQAIQELANNMVTSGRDVEAGINIEHLSVEIQPGVISSDYDARRAGEMALEEMLRIARKTGKNSISRR